MQGLLSISLVIGALDAHQPLLPKSGIFAPKGLTPARYYGHIALGAKHPHGIALHIKVKHAAVQFVREIC